MRARQKLSRLARHAGAERLVLGDVIEAGEHEVLPDHQSEFVAEIVEGVAFVEHRAADAQHVHARFAHPRQQGQIAFPLVRKPNEIGARPAGAAREHRKAVDDESETLAVRVAVDIDAAEAGAADIDGDAADICADAVQMRRPMRMRQPGRNIRNVQTGDKLVAIAPQRRRSAGAGEKAALRVAGE